MLIKRDNIKSILDIIEKVKNNQFNIQTQYKLIKLKTSIKEEEKIYQEQIQINCKPFLECDENDNPVVADNGGYKIKQSEIQQCYSMIHQLTSLQVQIPDIYFTLEELQELNLTFSELEVLEPFIKT